MEQGQWGQPEILAQPGFPVQPEQTVQPEFPVQQEQTVQPEIPVQPEQTVQPEYPVQPEQTVQPEAVVQTTVQFDQPLGQLEQEALAARTDEARLTELVASHRAWILRCASETTHRYITDSDDEWSIALMAFSEAVQNFEGGKGSFRGFAAMVIRRRILDYLRSQKRYGSETDVTPAAFEGDLPEEEAAGVNLQVQRQVAQSSLTNEADDLASRTREEIAEAQAILRPYGFSFYALADCSPRAEKTKRSCALAVRALLDAPDLMAKLRRTGALPMRDLSSDSGVPRKILDRHRRYIIAAAELLSGDFPILSAYMDYIRKV